VSACCRASTAEDRRLPAVGAAGCARLDLPLDPDEDSYPDDEEDEDEDEDWDEEDEEEEPEWLVRNQGPRLGLPRRARRARLVLDSPRGAP
jgi:hypothetical protein